MRKAKTYLNKIKTYMKNQGLMGKIPLFVIMIDLAWSTLVYGATISDYFMYRFYEKKHFARKQFMTAKDKNRFYTAMNDKTARKAVQNKDIFNEKFAEYLKRDSIAVPACGEETFCRFVQSHDAVFIKPVATGGGDGITKTTAGENSDLGALFRSLKKKGDFVVEAAIVQHTAMAALHPQSTNTLRVSTFFDGETVHVLFAALRCGTGESYVDNHSMGGIAMEVDPDTGKVSSRASCKTSLNVVKHPDTGVFLPGFQIPHWDKVLELVDRVARCVEDVHYVGWDVAILEDGICLIEANPSGNFDIFQESTQVGCKAAMDALIKDIQLKNKQR